VQYKIVQMLVENVILRENKMITNFEYMSNEFFNNKVIGKVTLSFTPYPLFQWYLQSKEILLNLKVRDKL
jgi:thermostable 8-oxoguanine DNA glycosylase